LFSEHDSTLLPDLSGPPMKIEKKRWRVYI